MVDGFVLWYNLKAIIIKNDIVIRQNIMKVFAKDSTVALDHCFLTCLALQQQSYRFFWVF